MARAADPAPWVAAGIIDAEQARRITAFEAERRSPVAMWTILALGALAVGLGLVSLIAANWQEVPGTIRLAIHAVLLIAAAGWAWWQALREHPPVTRDADEDELTGHPVLGDASRFVFGALALTFFGHVGQVYQTTAPLWQPLLAWLVIMTPLFLLSGRGWLVASAWLVGLLAVLSTHASDYLAGQEHVDFIYFGTIGSVPAMIAAGALIERARSGRRPAFWRALTYLALVATMIGASLFQIVFGIDGSDGEGVRSAAVGCAWHLSAAAIIAIWRRDTPGRASAAVVAAAGLTSLLAVLADGSAVVNAVMTMALFATLGWAALYAGWRTMFAMAVTAIALRLIVLSFQLSDNLLGSGLGLIIVGSLAIGIVLVAVRVMHRYAPPARIGA